jgi:hypothetical protein
MKCAKKTFNYRIENSNDLKTFIDTEEFSTKR